LRLNRFLLRTSRISAWILLAFMLVFIMTGYAWHEHIIMDPRQAAYIHTHLDKVLIFFFLVHSLTGARFALARHGLRPTRSLDLLILAIGVTFYLLVMMMT